MARRNIKARTEQKGEETGYDSPSDSEGEEFDLSYETFIKKKGEKK